jgi:hypothetical protein
MVPKKYTTATAFRRALEDRLQDIARKEGIDLQRLRRQVAFDRLLARLFQVGQPLALPWALKGGYAMELRIKAARTTKDIDLTMRGVLSPGEKKDNRKNLAVLEKLQEAAAFRTDDFFVYTIGEPISDLDAAPYGGARFPVEARLDGRVFVGFQLDVGIGDAVTEPLEVIEGRDWLGFAGIASPSLYISVNATHQSLCSTKNIQVGILRFDPSGKGRAKWRKAAIPSSYDSPQYRQAGLGESCLVQLDVCPATCRERNSALGLLGNSGLS